MRDDQFSNQHLVVSEPDLLRLHSKLGPPVENAQVPSAPITVTLHPPRLVVGGNFEGGLGPLKG